MPRPDELDLIDVEILEEQESTSQSEGSSGSSGVEIVIRDAAGEYETIVRAPRLPNEDLREFIWRAMGFGAGTGGAGTSPTTTEPIAKPNPQLISVEERLASNEELADLLLHPPAGFSEASKNLAQQIKEKIEAINTLGKAILVGVLTTLVTSDAPEIAVTQSYDVETVAMALNSLNSIARNRIRTLIALELFPETTSRIRPNERRWWRGLYDKLK